MATEVARDKMDAFFYAEEKQVDEQYMQSLYMNQRLLDMTTDELVVACRNFGLEPVRAYLDKRTIPSPTEDNSIRGFVRYMDTYLMEQSGGKRTELVRLGKELTGQEPTARPNRLLRLEIIYQYLTHILV